MTYPVLCPQMPEDDLIAHFTLNLGDWEIIKRIRNESSRLGFAVLLKTFRFLGYPPYHKSHIPMVVIEKIADQVGLSPALVSLHFGHCISCVTKGLTLRSGWESNP